MIQSINEKIGHPHAQYEAPRVVRMTPLIVGSCNDEHVDASASCPYGAICPYGLQSKVD